MVLHITLDSLFCVITESIEAKLALPPFPASIKDGYAVRSEWIVIVTELSVILSIIGSDGTGVRTVITPITAGETVSVVVVVVEAFEVFVIPVEAYSGSDSRHSGQDHYWCSCTLWSRCYCSSGGH